MSVLAEKSAADLGHAAKHAPDISSIASSIVVAIPAYNEGVSIGSVVLRAKEYVDNVVVVDDGSRDDTALVASLAGAHVIQHARNLGKGMAVRSAWLHARQIGAKMLVLIDGDYQHDPGDIPRLVEPIMKNDVDVTLGVRWGRTSGMPPYRRLGKRVLDYATATAMGGVVTDSQTGFRAYSERALWALEPTEPSHAIESQMLIEAQEKGLKLHEVQIRARYDVEGSTISPGKHGLKVLGAIVSILSERRPLFSFGVPGLAFLLIGLSLAVYTAELYYGSGVFAIGYALLVLLFAIVGVLSIFIGIVLNAMRRIMPR